MVSLLLSGGDDVRAATQEGWTALHAACGNVLHAREVISVLCAAGADPLARIRNGMAPIYSAAFRSVAAAQAMVPFLPAGYVIPRAFVFTAEHDGLASLAFWKVHGAGSPDDIFAGAGASSVAWKTAFLFLRFGRPLVRDGSDRDAFLCLEHSSAMELWKWASSELPHQHPHTGDTLFHLLCRTDKLSPDQKLAVLADYKRNYRNPLTPNYHNELCVQLTAFPELKKALESYMCWRPKRRVMEWFGPYFRPRVWTLLLVCYRLRAQHPKTLAGLNRDIRHLLVKYASKLEVFYVRSTR